MMETSSGMERDNVSNGNDEGTVMRIEDLPEGHLVRLVCRTHDEADAETPLDWNAVMQRLESAVGILEARQWVQTSSGERILFLHLMVCGSNAEEHNQREQIENRFRAALKAIDAYPEAVGNPSSYGDFPIHFLCGNPGFHRFYSRTADKLFKTVLSRCPEAVRIQVNGATTIHEFSNGASLASFMFNGSEYGSAVPALKMLLELFPEAVRIRDRDDYLPFHFAVCGKMFDVIKIILNAYPRAGQLTTPFGRSLIQGHLHSIIDNRSLTEARDYDVTQLLIETCPWMVAHDDDQSVLRWKEGHLQPTGDALDFMGAIYCEVIGMCWMACVTDSENAGENDEDEESDREQEYHHYFRSNVAFLEGGYSHVAGSEELREATLEMLVTMLRTMHGRLGEFLPLHAAVTGSLCRPWHLVAMNGLLSRFSQEANEVDSHGDLPLHSFLKSCIIEQERAIERGYVNDAQEYESAVSACFRMLLKANPEAVTKPNGDGRLPLHLALDHRSLSYDSLASPLLELEPRALLTRDIETRLYPFANAAIGANGNVDATFQLLRRDPTVLQRLDYSVVHDDSREMRKRKRDE